MEIKLNKNYVFSKDSDGVSREYTYDKNNNMLTYKDSDGFSEKY